ncbi:myristylated protein [Cetacean poxvirus 1]|nr:myristylated protein [Cetacean poxvirus 1]
MGTGISIKKIDVIPDDTDTDKNYLLLSFNDITYNRIVGFYEDKKIYDNDSVMTIDPKFCLPNTVDVSYCGSFLSEKLSKQYIAQLGTPCKSIAFRPGSLIEFTKQFPDDIPDTAKQYIVDGHRCKFIKNDFQVMDDDISRCCSDYNAKGCPKILQNGYITSNCDNFMKTYCKENPDSVNCLDWLRQRSNASLSTYSDICSNNMDTRYCSEFIRVTRPDVFSFGDSSLRNYCKSNSGNRNCLCAQQPSDFNNLETQNNVYAGPRVCWLQECTNESKDRKWLYYEQDIQRTRCKYVGCNINIDSLTLKNSYANLISDCYRGEGKLGDIDPGKPINHNNNHNIFLFNFNSFIIIFISLAILFYFILIYSRKIIKTNNINVRRR